ncbi:MAG: acetyltransferase [Cytophagaceae bacterium]|jgi:sugar O-acyltransferase (sialic acid O-acetyltransferase NeuD family)|nr:acetyltransferase [Cytophagaceae bacterium]
MERNEAVIIFGAGGLGQVAQEIVESNGLVVYGFLDDKKEMHGKEIHLATVLGDTDDEQFLKLIGQKCDAVVAIDEPKLKQHITRMLLDTKKIQPMNAVHQQVNLSPKSIIGYGNLINIGVTIAAHTTIGSHCIVHAGAVLDHSATLEDYVQVGSGAILGASVTVEEGAFIGAGAVVVSGVKIGKNARIGAGSVVISDVKSGQTVFGNPAQPVKA